MCSLPHDGSRLPIWGLSLSSIPNPIAAVSGQTHGLHGHGLLPSSLSSVLGRPVAALGRLVDDLQAAYRQDAAASRELEERKAILRINLLKASTLEEWRTAAAELDEVEGNNPWKEELESSEYNHPLIQSRLEQLDSARESCDASRMLFLVRTALSRNLGGMDNVNLYRHTHIGTKQLVERYIDSALGTIDSLLEITQHQYQSLVSSRQVLEGVLAARQSFGRSALLLSGGGTFGMSHIGVTKCLWEQRLLPRIISGASAGSIVCAVLCVKTDDEIPATLEDFCYGDLEVFTKTGSDDGVLTQLARFLKVGALFDIGNLTRVMKNLLGDLTFQEAYNRTRRVLNITVSSAGVFELPKLLNYVTAPNVLIWSAVAASCSVPFIFSPAGILAKDPNTGAAAPWNPSPQQWIDGSVDNDLPMTRLAEMFNVNHFIVSQVNPHVVPFLAQEEHDKIVAAQESESAFHTGPEWLSIMANMAKDEVMHRMNVLSEMGIFPNILGKTRSILSQRYSGDITILPEVSYSQFPKVLQNPTTDFMIQALLHGERATWPKLGRIQNHCAIELALDDAIQHLRARIAFSPSQVDLRLNAMARPHSRAGSDGSRPISHRIQRKKLRFSGELDRSAFKPNSSRPVTVPDGSSGPVSDLKNGSQTPAGLTQSRRAASSFHLDLQKHASAPIFSTGSGGDSDSEASDSSSQYHQENSPAKEQRRSTQPGTTTPTELWPSTRQLFPHASQPSTPAEPPNRRSYFGTRPPTPVATPLVSSMAQLSMTSSLHPATPSTRTATPSVQESNNNKSNSPSLSPVQRRSSAGSSRSSLDLDASGTRGMLRRKKSSLSKGLKALGRSK